MHLCTKPQTRPEEYDTVNLMRKEGPDVVDAKGFLWQEFHFPRAALERLERWKEEGTYNELLTRQDGPFGEYGSVCLHMREGKQWMRMKLAMTNAMVDLEMLASGYIGEIVPVSAEEAARLTGEQET